MGSLQGYQSKDAIAETVALNERGAWQPIHKSRRSRSAPREHSPIACRARQNARVTKTSAVRAPQGVRGSPTRVVRRVATIARPSNMQVN